MCTYCGKNDHTVDACYRKHGCPLGWGVARGNASINNVGHNAQEDGAEIKIKIDEGSML